MTEPFEMVCDHIFLSREEIAAFYDSRYCMMINFDCIELPRYHCSYTFDEPIPTEVARGLYGANLSVTLLHRNSGALVLLDGCRCYPIWKDAVSKNELSSISFMNVIEETRNLNEFQCLQLATYSNIKARDTHMSAMWEKVYVTFAFYAAFMDMHDELGGFGGISDKIAGNSTSICSNIGKGLYLTSFFDEQISQPVRNRDIGYIEKLVWNTCHGCIQLSVEKELMAVILHFSREEPALSREYFDIQFFFDYPSEWFQSSPLLKQILLLFVLPSFPFVSGSSAHSQTLQVRANLRGRIPGICDQISCFLYSYIFQDDCDVGTETVGEDSVAHNKMADFDIPFIHELAYEMQTAIRLAESNVLLGKVQAVDRNLDNIVIGQTKHRMMQYSVSIADKNLYLLFK